MALTNILLLLNEANQNVSSENSSELNYYIVLHRIE